MSSEAPRGGPDTSPARPAGGVGGPDIDPGDKARVQAGLRGWVQPTAGQRELPPAVGQEVRPATGQEAQPAAGLEVRSAAGQEVQPAAGQWQAWPIGAQEVQPAAGQEKVWPIAGQEVQPTAGQETQPGDLVQQATNRRGVCLVLCAASGAGKSSIGRALLASEPALRLSISVTTRAPRPGETEGEHYFFRSLPEFHALVAQGEIMEHAEVFGRFYGSPRAAVRDALEAGRDVLFDIDWQGHRQLRVALPGDVVCVHLLPPSLAELERRLGARGQDSAAEVARRMAAARDEIAHWTDADHVLVNGDFAATVAGVRAVLHAARSARPRQPGLAGLVAGLLAP